MAVLYVSPKEIIILKKMVEIRIQEEPNNLELRGLELKFLRTWVKLTGKEINEGKEY